MGKGDTADRLSHASSRHSADRDHPGYSLRCQSAASDFDPACIAAPWSNIAEISLSL